MATPLPLLDNPPPGWEYVFHLTLVGGEEHVAIMLEQLPPEPNWVEGQLEAAGIDTSHGILSVICAILLSWQKLRGVLEGMGWVKPKKGRREADDEGTDAD